jgi:hypothetical protein
MQSHLVQLIQQLDRALRILHQRRLGDFQLEAGWGNLMSTEN